MRRTKFLIRKEIKQILRDKIMLMLIFVMPIIQMVILSFAATYEVKNLNIIFVDKDKSTFSQQLISKFEASKYFIVKGSIFNTKLADSLMKNRKVDIYVEIPQKFEQTLIRTGKNEINLITNAIDGTKGTFASIYTQMILADFLKDKSAKYAIKMNKLEQVKKVKNIDLQYSNWFNPYLNYKFFMLPGLIVVLVSMISLVLTALNIVREKEIGTIESLNVTPIRKYEFILAKLIPIWLIGMFELMLGLSISLLFYNVPLIGSPIALIVFGGIYLLVPLGLGLLISTMTKTQQQAMLFAWFFNMVFLLLSGLFTAIENMPHWAQMITYFNPVRYFIEVIRMVMLKGSGFAEISFHLSVVAIMGLMVITLAVFRYRKTAG